MKTVSVVGARGYSGQELVRYLLRHPEVRLTHAFATSTFALNEEVMVPGIERVQCLPDSEIFDNQTDVVFLATPAEVSAELAPRLLAKGSTVIDLSGAFRLEKFSMREWYGFELKRDAKEIQTEYGLVPFVGAKTTARLLSNPGCYSTCALMALIPLLKNNLIEIDSIVIDGKSGTTGAGRKANDSLLFSEADENCTPYKIGKHQHWPEIVEAAQFFSGKEINPHFATHLLPVRRGLICGIYAKAKTKSKRELQDAYLSAFQDYPLVRQAPLPNGLTALNKIANTPYTHIAYELSHDKLYVFSLIDNLLKGAATQAIENLNRHLDLPIATGLIK